MRVVYGNLAGPLWLVVYNIEIPLLVYGLWTIYKTGGVSSPQRTLKRMRQGSKRLVGVPCTLLSLIRPSTENPGKRFI